MPATKAAQLRSANGFTLVELLVVILIIGILASIAIPSFLNQRRKALDKCPQIALRNAQNAAQVFKLDSQGLTFGMTLARLNAIERTVSTAANGGCNGATSFGVFNAVAANAGCGAAIPATSTTYCLRIISSTTVRYNLHQAANGTVTRRCWVPAGANRGGCPTSGLW